MDYYTGDDNPLEFELFKDDAKTQPWDLTDYEIRFELFNADKFIKKATSNVNGGSDTQIKLNTETPNEFIIYLNKEDTLELASSSYDFEIEVTNISTGKKTTVAYDRIEFVKDRIRWNSPTE